MVFIPLAVQEVWPDFLQLYKLKSTEAKIYGKNLGDCEFYVQVAYVAFFVCAVIIDFIEV